MEILPLKRKDLPFSGEERCTFLFAKNRTSVFAENCTFLIAEKCTLLFSDYTGTGSLPEIPQRFMSLNVRGHSEIVSIMYTELHQRINDMDLIFIHEILGS